ncbi:MAG: zf-TFIIB domain-containing protein [Microcella sp.]|uniref:TFIIB-type zinc ribbon-containing protein n=1 Tax=Microcella sp. TaxID=1913979 RepID=UPI002725B1F1|nr:zf-TFIIB domain-containing protein [Microcella sp.]MDO8336754.1 zf-TFIIB domain-containing protein [Microcella sp.]
MKCPADDAVLVMSERNGIEIDYCPQCRGVWLDRGELDKIIERAASFEAASAAPTAPAAPAAPRVDLPRDVPPAQPGGFPAPGYAQPGYAAPYGDPAYGRQRWGSNSPSSAPRYGQGGYPRKRKNWLGELFD